MNKLSDNTPKKYPEKLIDENGVKIFSEQLHNVSDIRIKIEGNATVNNVHLFKNVVEQNIKLFDNLKFSLENLKEIDLSYIQIFNLIQFSNKYKNKTITIENKLPENETNTLIFCGYDNLFSINE